MARFEIGEGPGVPHPAVRVSQAKAASFAGGRTAALYKTEARRETDGWEEF